LEEIGSSAALLASMFDNKSKVVTVHTMKAYGEEEASFHILNLGTKWELVVIFMCWLLVF
jgi:hypothetical protein